MRVRNYTEADFDQLFLIQRECFPPPYPAEQLWSRGQIASHVAHFAPGAMCVEEDDGTLVASCTALLMRFDPAHPQHTWMEIADRGFIRTHDPIGDSLYGIDVAVRPAWRGRGVARLMYQARFALVRQRKLRRFLAGSRLSGYHRHADRLSAEAYAAEVVAGRLSDPVITPQLKAGLTPLSLIHGYIPDEESRDCALLMEWRNQATG